MFRIFTFCFNILWPVLVSWDESMRLASRFPPLCCYFAEHCRLSHLSSVKLIACVLYRMRPFFDVHVAVHRDKFLIIEPTRCTNFSIFFILEWNSTCFRQFLCPSSGVFHCTHSKPVWHIPLLCVQWKTPDDGQKNCLKHVEFHYKI